MYLHSNLRTFREKESLKQTELETQFGLSKGVWSTYETSTTPKIQVLLNIVKYFSHLIPNLSIDSLVTIDYSYLNPTKQPKNSNQNGILKRIESIENGILKEILMIPELKELFIKELVNQILTNSNFNKSL